MSQSTLANHSIKLQTSGPQPLTLTPITVAKKESQSVSERTLRARTNQSKDVLEMIPGSSEAISTQTTNIVKNMGVTAREEIIKELDVVIKISPEQVAAMKSCLSIPWNLFREMRRWLATFKVSIASEELSRKVREAWIGDGLQTE